MARRGRGYPVQTEALRPVLQGEYNGFGFANPGLSGPFSGNLYLGTAFKTTVSNQQCAGMRVYLPSGATNQTGGACYLHDTSGGYPTSTVLASGTLNLVNGQWNEVRWATPVDLAANTVYYVVMQMQSNYYAISSEFTSDVNAPSGAAGLVFPADSTSNHNGVFNTTDPPNQTFNATWYGSDVILRPIRTAIVTLAGPVTGLTVAAPAGAVQTGVSLSGAVGAVSTAALAGAIDNSTSVGGPVATITVAALTGSLSTGTVLAGATAAQAITATAGTVNITANIAGPTPPGLTTAAVAGIVHIHPPHVGWGITM